MGLRPQQSQPVTTQGPSENALEQPNEQQQKQQQQQQTHQQPLIVNLAADDDDEEEHVVNSEENDDATVYNDFEFSALGSVGTHGLDDLTPDRSTAACTDE